MARNPKHQYPTLTALILAMALENDMKLKPVKDWSWPQGSKLLEDQASTLTDEEIEALGAGCGFDDDQEYDSPNDWAEAHGMTEVSDFLDSVFDGDLADNFKAPRRR